MSWKSGGSTPIGTNLRFKILEPLIYHKIRNKSFKRPLLIFITTDGIPSAEGGSAFADAILECGEKLEEVDYPRKSVKFMVGQIGTSSRAIEDHTDLHILEKLDKKLKRFHDNDREFERWVSNP
ncbi:uncharacterized protein F4812DRAFT_455352 [Daldinia caldariorum]|uniref:uncharacterized protein n=1 Tax=Daldinia caldariorum TaxID=326644 RepID=UPI0020081A3E|nr:uncharacterized protein F4812DRAFT_455352 [Daldinia caldariorum]KAI1471240.1 hypothetical protein F4812DRAFT_455352 [Daldinia caldariorum]